MKQISKRHHYIPQFYLRGFTNSNGRFKIYDTVNKRFINHGKFFSTESYFFERDGNSLIKDNRKDDFIESKFYKEEDQFFANLLKRINKAPKGTNFGLSDSDMPLLQLFVAIMFWRLPSNFFKIKTLLGQNDFSELGFKFVNKENQIVTDAEKINKLRNDPNFAKAMKFGIPFSTFPQILKCNSLLRIQSYPDGLPSLCSDNPIIFRNSENPNVYTDDYIFPLSSNKILLRAKQFNDIWSTFKITIDWILLNQTIKYVSCTDERYIYELNNLKTNLYGNIDELRELVFKQLFD